MTGPQEIGLSLPCERIACAATIFRTANQQTRLDKSRYVAQCGVRRGFVSFTNHRCDKPAFITGSSSVFPLNHSRNAVIPFQHATLPAPRHIGKTERSRSFRDPPSISRPSLQPMAGLSLWTKCDCSLRTSKANLPNENLVIPAKCITLAYTLIFLELEPHRQAIQ